MRVSGFVCGFALSAFLIITGSQAHAKWVGTQAQSDQPAEFKVLKSDADSTLVEFRADGFEAEKVVINGKEYTSIVIPGLNPTEEKGLPALPRLGKDIAIPNGAKTSFVIKVVEKKTFKVGAVVPSKGTLTRDVNPANVPFTFASNYSTQSYPSKHLVMGKPFTLRDVQGVNLTFFPVRYNPATKEVVLVTRMLVEVRTEGGTPSAQLKGKGVDTSFLKLYGEHFANFSLTAQPGIQDISHWVTDTHKVLFVANPKFAESLKPLVNWKLQKGLEVKLATLNETGNTWQTIKAYINNEYKTNKVSYVVLVGDSPEVPFHPGTDGNVKGAEADPMFGLIDGSDSYPEVIISRISVKTTDELDYVANKIVNYEKTPDTAGTWYNRAVGIASNETDSSKNPTDWQRLEMIRDMLEKWHFTGTDQIYDKSGKAATAAQVTAAVNDGRSFINYTGHGSQYSWGTTGFANTNIDALNNGMKQPFIVSVACVNGAFGKGSDVFAERWIKAGNKDNPKGAIAIFASSTNQSWVPPTVGQKEITNLLVNEKLNTVGALFTHGSIAVLEDNSDSAIQTFQSWHTFGDATVQVRTQKPMSISAKGPDFLTVGATEFSVDVDGADIMAGVLQGGKQIARGISGKDGRIVLKLASALSGSEPLKLTLTGFDRVPAVASIEVKN